MLPLATFAHGSLIRTHYYLRHRQRDILYHHLGFILYHFPLVVVTESALLHVSPKYQNDSILLEWSLHTGMLLPVPLLASNERD